MNANDFKPQVIKFIEQNNAVTIKAVKNKFNWSWGLSCRILRELYEDNKISKGVYKQIEGRKIIMLYFKK